MDARILAALDRLHARVRESALLYRFALGTRVLLAAAFIPTGTVKALGLRFANFGTHNDVGLFFEVMYRSGEYWRFIGLMQIAAGVLLLIPRTATLGAVLFAPIAVNIFWITVGYGFQGTPVVTGLMLLAVLFLLCWDWHRLRPILTEAPPAALPLAAHRLTRMERVVWTAGAVGGLAFFFGTRSLVPAAASAGGLMVAAIALVAALPLATHALIAARRTAL